MDWTAFYNDALGPYRKTASNQMRALTSDPISSIKSLNFNELQESFGKLTGADAFYEMPNPAASSASGEEVQAANEAGANLLSEIADWFPRIAIIVLGFIFVAAGLSLFKVPVVVQTVGKVSETV